MTINQQHPTKMMLEVPESVHDVQTNVVIKVQNPKKEEDSYVSYEIVIETNDPSFSHPKSSTRRRYSDFKTLSKLLSKQLPYNKLPPLPPKEPFKNPFDFELINRRQETLQIFLNGLVSDRMFLSSKALHLFLQSSLPMLQIKDIVNGKTSFEMSEPVLNFYESHSSTIDGFDERISNECISDDSTNACAILEPTSELNVNSLDSKRVSFCDQVTVAEVHIS